LKPLCIDLFCGLGGWTEGFLSEGYECIGFDIERHQYGTEKYPGQLVLQDVLTLHGSQFKDAAIIVASPPCQEYSYMAMPWHRSKQIAAALRGHGEFPKGYTGSRTVAELNALFEACFRIQREACEAAGHHIPLVVENVRGAQKWVGRAAWNFGSYYLWGDVPALMPNTRHRKLPGHDLFYLNGSHVGKDSDGLKNARNWWSDGAGNLSATTSSHSPARKAASAQIAKIPRPLSEWIARCYKPTPPSIFSLDIPRPVAL